MSIPPSQLPPPDDAPLPHLVGPAPVPRDVKRGRIALWGSLAAWVVSAGIMAFFVAASDGVKTIRVPGNSGGHGSIDGRTVVAVLFLINTASCIAGSAFGIASWKHRTGKWGLALSIVNALFWTLILVAGLRSP